MALVNKRDITIDNSFSKIYLKNSIDSQYRILHDSARSYIDKIEVDSIQSSNEKKHFKDQLDSFGRWEISSLNNIDSSLGRQMLQTAKDSGFSFFLNTHPSRFDTAKVNEYIKNKFSKIKSLADGTGKGITKMENTHISKLKNDLECLFNDSTFTFDKADPDLQNVLEIVGNKFDLTSFNDSLSKHKDLNIFKEKNRGFKDLKDLFQKRGLWTIGVSDTSYSDGYFFKNLVFTTEWTKGIFGNSKKADWEWDVKGSVIFGDDTFKPGRNLRRQSWYIEPGLNFSIKNKKQQSFFELKLSGGVNYVFNGTYQNEKPLDITLNGTLRIKVFDEIWIPIQIKYDPKSGNVFGFLNVTTNFTGLGNLLKGSSSKAKSAG